MLKLIIRVLLTALSVVVLAEILPGISVDGYATSIVVAIVLGVLRLVVKPLLVLFTLPLTILTLGLFLVVINAFIVTMAGYLITGFHIASFGWAILFSLLLSLFQIVLFSFIGEDK